MAQHALLSPSASDRWLHCTPSARMEAAFPPEESAAALEGTLCHELADLYLVQSGNASFDSRDRSRRQAVNILRDIRSNGFDGNECITMVQQYADAVTGTAQGAELHVEERVNLSSVFHDCFGTVDCWFVRDTTLYVFDAKFGRTPVDAVGNSQLIIYAIGALLKNGDEGIDTVSMNIVQPRDGGLKSWTMDTDGLMAHIPSFSQKADLAYMGAGMVAEGRWCTYCRAKALCPLMRQKMGRKAATLRRNAAAGYLRRGFYGIAGALELAPMMKKYIESVEDFARRHMENGGRIEGYDLKPGNRRTSLTDPAGFLEWAATKGLNTDVLKTEQVLPLKDLKTILNAFDYEEAVQNFCTTTHNKSSIIKSK